MKKAALIILLAATTACGTSNSDKTTENTTSKTDTSTATTTASTNTPLSTCKNIVELTMKKDFEGMQKLTWMGHGHMNKKAQKGFDKMHNEKMAQLEKLTCTSEVIAQDRAFVEATTEGNKRLIPFVKTEAGWMFDAKTYMSFYDMMGKGHGGMMGKGKGKM